MNARTDQIMMVPSQAVSGFSLVPQNLRDAMELAKLIADSDLAPKDYKGKPGNVLIAVQMGQEVGLSPMAAVQNIAVINGKPGIYGDAGKAILLAKGFLIEEDDIEVIKKTGRGRCKITRPGNPKPCERTFAIDNAKTAGLWGKQGPWTQYPERQLAWRAFWFAARDIASDVLKGLRGAEEVLDTERDITTEGTTLSFKDAKPEKQEPPTYPEDKFAENLPKWSELVLSGKKTAADIVTMVCSKYTLTDAQRAKIAVIDIRAKATAASITEAEVCRHLGVEALDGIGLDQAEKALAFIANPTAEAA